MRQLNDSERIARDVAKSSSDVPYLADDLEHYIFDMGFIAGLDHRQAEIDELTFAFNLAAEGHAKLTAEIAGGAATDCKRLSAGEYGHLADR